MDPSETVYPDPSAGSNAGDSVENSSRLFRRAIRTSQVANSIRGLHDLHRSGALTLEEFQQAKQSVLSDMNRSSSSSSSRAGSQLSERPHRHHHGANNVKSRRSKPSSHSLTQRSTRSPSRSSSSSSSSSSGFMVAPRAKVWLPLQDDSDVTAEYAKEDAASVDVAVRCKTPTSPLERHSSQDAPSLQTAAAEVRGALPSASSKRYGTFSAQWQPQQWAKSTGTKQRGRLQSSNEVYVRCFNCRGASGERFQDVKLKEEELRQPILLRKRGSSTSFSHGLMATISEADLASIAVEEKRSVMESLFSSLSTKSNLEMCLNWYWIDVVGRDPSRKKYNAVLRFLTKRFNISETFLTDRDHTLVLPQIYTSPEVPSQFLICLRVATPQIALDDDSVLELTNRWIIVVDLELKLIITIHRMDCVSMANLRHQWKSLMDGSNISFQEFLVKILDDAVHTYKASLDVHADLLDVCESKLFISRLHHAPREMRLGEEYSNMKILSHFSNSSRSPFLLHLLDKKNTRPMEKSSMNMFLYHLHRRTNVQYRMLSLSKEVLAESYTKLRLCSKEHANQMCVHCLELGDRALEIRDDAKTILNLHISLQSFRANELMAVLTKFSVFFTPCTFLAGVYGMNFRYMPELEWRFGYPFYWTTCLLVCLFIYFYMHRIGVLS